MRGLLHKQKLTAIRLTFPERSRIPYDLAHLTDKSAHNSSTENQSPPPTSTNPTITPHPHPQPPIPYHPAPHSPSIPIHHQLIRKCMHRGLRNIDKRAIMPNHLCTTEVPNHIAFPTSRLRTPALTFVTHLQLHVVFYAPSNLLTSYSLHTPHWPL